MKKTLLIISSLIFSIAVNAQWATFENWTSNNILELDDYESSVNDNGLEGANATYRVADPVTGTYSIKLETVLSSYGDTIFGYFLSGDPDTQAPGQAITLTGSVDSLVGWYKYNILAGDSAVILCATTKLSNPSGGVTAYVKGTQTTWKRFAYPLNAILGADSMLLAAATGNPLNDFKGKPGSWIQFDDLQIKGASGTMNVLNYSFENWSPISWDEPNGWNTTNLYAIGESVMPVFKTTNSYAGTYAVQLNTILSMRGDTIPGAITNGTFGNNGPQGGVPFVGTPVGVECYYNYYPTNNDTGIINFEFRQGGNVVANAGNQFTTTVGSWTLWSSTLPAITPDTVLITLWAGNNPNSVFRVDNINISYPVGIAEGLTVEKLVAYPNPVVDQLKIKFNIENDNNVSIRLIDAQGKELTARNLGNLSSGTYRETFNTSNFSSGIYFIEFLLDNKKIIERFIIK